MYKKLMTLVLTLYLTLGATGCAITTTGDAGWEIYCGVRTKQYSQEPAKVEIESNIAKEMIDSFLGRELITKDDGPVLKALWWGAKWYFGVPGILDAF